jgi:hypothetical protein
MILNTKKISKIVKLINMYKLIKKILFKDNNLKKRLFFKIFNYL